MKLFCTCFGGLLDKSSLLSLSALAVSSISTDACGTHPPIQRQILSVPSEPVLPPRKWSASDFEAPSLLFKGFSRPHSGLVLTCELSHVGEPLGLIPGMEIWGVRGAVLYGACCALRAFVFALGIVTHPGRTAGRMWCLVA